jgi:YnbE-like lipoprotein
MADGTAGMKERSMSKRQTLMAGAALALAMTGAACTPTVKLQAPDKPIVINLNVKIDQEVRVHLDKEVDDLIAKHPDAFS